MLTPVQFPIPVTPAAAPDAAADETKARAIAPSKLGSVRDGASRPHPSTGDLAFGILGPVEVRLAGRTLNLKRGRQRALLAMLLVNRGRPLQAAELIEGLWEDPPRTARTALHGLVSELRRSLAAAVAGGDELLELTPSGYVLHAELLDAHMFDELVGESDSARQSGDLARACELLDRALGLWRGPPLADVALEPFAQPHVLRLEESLLAAREQRLELEFDLGRHVEVIPQLRSLVREQPLRERPRALLMLALYRAGRQAEALEAFRDFRRQLIDELGLEPSHGLRALHQAILEQRAELELRPAAVGDPVRLASRKELVGRRQELERLVSLVEDPSSRLVTLTGPGGIGKTSLAMAAMRMLAHRYRDGAVPVHLASVREPALVMSTIAVALGQNDASQSPASAVAQLLSTQNLLLVLDNFEQVSAAAPELQELLHAAPELTIMVTSRRPLGLESEREFAVPPLSMPDGERHRVLAKADAVEFFVDRARRVDPDFHATESGLHAIVDICRRLEALPLALELAASRVGVLSLPQLCARLERALPLLSVGASARVADRHRTMRAALTWSEQLLQPSTRAVFARLSVFLGGFDLDAAAAVCLAPGQPEVELLDALCELREHSLLLREADRDGQARFRMLEVIREYAQELLDARPDEAAAARRLHAEFYAKLCERAEAEMMADEQATWLRRLDVELANLRAALSFSLATDQHDPSTALRIIGSARRFWWMSGHIREALTWADRAVRSAQTPASPQLAKALSAGTAFANIIGDRSAARDFGQRALALARELDDPILVVSAATNCANVAISDGDDELAERLIRECLVHAGEIGDPGMRGIALCNLGGFELGRGRDAVAGPLLAQAIPLLREAKNLEWVAHALNNQAQLHYRQNRLVPACRELIESLQLLRSVREHSALSLHCLVVACAILSEREPALAARAIGLTDSQVEHVGASHERDVKAMSEHARAAARRALGPVEFERAFEEGQAADREAMLDELVAALEAVARTEGRRA